MTTAKDEAMRVAYRVAWTFGVDLLAAMRSCQHNAEVNAALAEWVPVLANVDRTRN